MSIGPRIKELREKKRISQQELAKFLGYKSASHLCEVEKGRRDLSSEKIRLAAKMLEVDVNQIFLV